MRRLVALLLFAGSVTVACVIGPKHDDPETDLAAKDAGTDEDGAFTMDTTPGSVSDTGTADNLDAISGGGDTAKSDDAGDAGDAAKDAGDAIGSDAPDAIDDAIDAAEGG